MAALFAGCMTIVLFILILLTPWIRGVEPDVRETERQSLANGQLNSLQFRLWRESGILSSIIPVRSTLNFSSELSAELTS